MGRHGWATILTEGGQSAHDERTVGRGEERDQRGAREKGQVHDRYEAKIVPYVRFERTVTKSVSADPPRRGEKGKKGRKEKTNKYCEEWWSLILFKDLKEGKGATMVRGAESLRGAQRDEREKNGIANQEKNCRDIWRRDERRAVLAKKHKNKAEGKKTCKRLSYVRTLKGLFARELGEREEKGKGRSAAS